MRLARHKRKGYLGTVFAKSVPGFPIDWMKAEVTFLDKNIDQVNEYMMDIEN